MGHNCIAVCSSWNDNNVDILIHSNTKDLHVSTHQIAKLFVGADVNHNNGCEVILKDRHCSVLFNMMHGSVGLCDVGIATFI